MQSIFFKELNKPWLGIMELKVKQKKVELHNNPSSTLKMYLVSNNENIWIRVYQCWVFEK